MYVGDSKRKGIYRKPTQSLITCEDPRIDKFICMNWEDLEALVNHCRDWEE